MKENKLDKFDLKLINELEQDARQPLSSIAKKLKTSQQVVSYRMKSLEKRKIIGSYYTIINLTKLGYTSYRTMIRFSNITDSKHKEIIDYLMKQGNVLWLVDCSGRWDLLVNFMAKNIIHYSEMLRNFKNKFPLQIQNYDILTTLEVIYLGRNYFLEKKLDQNILPSFGGKWETISLNKKDLQILDILSENARINSVDIAEKINTSPNTVILRIKDLLNKGIIQGFKPLIHLENTGYSGYKTLIKFHNITDKKENEIINYLKLNLHVVGIIRIVGSWEFEIEFEVKNREEMLNFTRNIRDKFKEIIKEFELLLLHHEYKYNFFPRDIIQKNNLKENDKNRVFNVKESEVLQKNFGRLKGKLEMSGQEAKDMMRKEIHQIE